MKYNVSKREAKRLGIKRYKLSKKKSKKSKKTKNSVPSKIRGMVKGLPADLQEIAIANYNITKDNNEQKARWLDQSLDMATKDANPYWKSIIRIAQDEIVRSFDESKGDFDSGLQRLQRRRKELSEDLASNKEYLSLEEQSALARQDQTYQVQEENLVNKMADQGLTFSTKKNIAEKRLKDYTTDIQESTKRQYGKRIQELETQALRGDTAAQTEMTDLKRKFGETITGIGRKAEGYFGSENIGDLGLGGYTALGGLSGTMQEDKLKDINTRQDTYYNELSRGSLNFA